MDAHSLSRQPSFPHMNPQQHPQQHQQMFYPQQQRPAISADLLAAGVQRYIPTPQQNIPHGHQGPPHAHQPRPYGAHPHPHSQAFMSPHGPRQTSYITLPPGYDPATVDFRTFFPYNPSEVKHRKRTTRAQLKVLEDTFKTETKPNGALRKKLAGQLDMTPRGVQVWFQNRRAKEKTIAKKASAAGSKSINLSTKGSSDGNADDNAELDEDCEEAGADAENELDGDEDGIRTTTSAANNTRNHHSGEPPFVEGASGAHHSSHPSVPPYASGATSSDSLGFAASHSAINGGQGSSLSKSTSPESTPPEMTPPNGLLDISVNVEHGMQRSEEEISMRNPESAIEDKRQLSQHGQNYWNANGAFIPRAASRTPTLSFDTSASVDPSSEGSREDTIMENPSQELLARRPSLPTHLSTNAFPRVPNGLGSRTGTGGATGPHRSSTVHSGMQTGGYARMGPSVAGFDPNARRMSLERLAVHPYAYAAMQQNTSVYGPGAVTGMAGLGPPTGMGLGRFRPTLPATTHSTPTGTPQARTNELPVPPVSATSQLPTIHSAGSAVATDGPGMDAMSMTQDASNMAVPPHSGDQQQTFQQMQHQSGAFDDMGRMIGQMGNHNVVVSPRSYAPPTAGPLPEPDFSFGSVGRENGESKPNLDETTANSSEKAGHAVEDANRSRTSTESEAPMSSGFNYQQSHIKAETQDANMGDSTFEVLDPTTHLTQGHVGSNMSFASITDNGTNGVSGSMYYRDNSSGGIVPLDNYSRFGSIVSIAESESSMTSGACFSSEAGSMMQHEHMNNGTLPRPSNAYMETRRPSNTGQLMDMFSNLDVHNGSNASLPHSIDSHHSHPHHQNRDSMPHSMHVPQHSHNPSMAGQVNMGASSGQAKDKGYRMSQEDDRSPGAQSQRSSMSSPGSTYSTNNYGGLAFAPTSAPSLAHSATSSRSSLSLSIPPSLSPLSQSHSNSSVNHPYQPHARRHINRQQNRSRLHLENTDKLDFLRADFDDVSGTGHYSPISQPPRDFFGSATNQSTNDFEFAHAGSSSSLNLSMGGDQNQGQDMEMTFMSVDTQAQSPYFGGYNGSRYSVNSQNSSHYSASFHY